MIKISRDTKIIQVMVIDANEKAILALQKALGEIKKTLPFDAEFFITNENIRFRDIKFMIKELFDLYKMEKKSREDAVSKKS